MLSENKMLDMDLLDDEEEEDTQQDKFLTFFVNKQDTGSASNMSQRSSGYKISPKCRICPIS